METNKIYQGDCLEVMKTFPDESINCCMTSPPYWALRDYGTANWEGGDINCNHIQPTGTILGKKSETFHGSNTQDAHKIQYKEICGKCGAKRVDKQLGLEPTFTQYINKLCDIFDEVKRVLRKDGTLWVNIGDTYGQNFRGSNKNNCSKIQLGNKGTIDFMGKSAYNTNLPNKSLCNIPARFSIEMQNRGWILRNVIIWHKPNCMPSSIKDRFTVDFEYLYFFVKSKKYWFETQYEPHKRLWDETNGGNLKESSNWVNESKALQKGQHKGNYPLPNPQGRNKRAVWTITTKPFKEAHFATYPEALCETPIKAGCPEFVCNKCGKPREKIFKSNRNIEEEKQRVEEKNSNTSSRYKSEGKILTNDQTTGMQHRDIGPNGEVGMYNKTEFTGKYTDCNCNAGFSGGIVLDPFFGAGTTGLVAMKQNKNFIGIELSPKYCKIAKERINKAKGEMGKC